MAKKQLTPNQQIIENDITLYKTNSRSSLFIYLALAFGCLYFLCVYGQQAGARDATFKNGDYVYTWMMGISVVLNLAVLLVGFLASQELKNYNKFFSYVVWIIAVIQIVRIFIYPIQTYSSSLSVASGGGKIFSAYSLVFMIIWLVLSAVCYAIAGYLGFVGAVKREKFIKQVSNNEVDLEAAYKEEDAPVEEAAVAEEVSANA